MNLGALIGWAFAAIEEKKAKDEQNRLRQTHKQPLNQKTLLYWRKAYGKIDI